MSSPLTNNVRAAPDPAASHRSEHRSAPARPAVLPPAPPPLAYREAAARWDNAAAVPAIRALFDALNEMSVRYCHWKSNVRLGETLAGDQDIDLLVDRRDLPLFQVIMARCGFRATVERRSLGHPGVFHALALDERTGRLVDLHVYQAVVSGDSLVKTYRFPILERLLDEVTTLAGVRVPRPEIELLTFVMRTALKHTAPLEVLKVARKYEECTSELAWLRQAANAADAEELLPQLFPPVDAVLYRRLLEALADKDALLRRIALGWMLARRLRPYRRIGRAAALASRTARLFVWLRGKALNSGHLSLTGGGAIVALVGPKGTGKSTLSARMAAELGRHLAIRPIHSGKPPATALTAVPRLFLPLARRLLPHERLSEYERLERRTRHTYSLFHVARMCQLAYDRSRLLSRAFRAAAGGAVVISDRYPSPTLGAIDSRSFDDGAIEEAGSWLKRMLMRWERALYRDMPAPDIVVRLVAPVDVAIARDALRNKAGGPDATAVLRRWDLETVAEYPSAKVFLLENSGSVDDAARQALRLVWGAL